MPIVSAFTRSELQKYMEKKTLSTCVICGNELSQLSSDEYIPIITKEGGGLYRKESRGVCFYCQLRWKSVHRIFASGLADGELSGLGSQVLELTANVLAGTVGEVFLFEAIKGSDENLFVGMTFKNETRPVAFSLRAEDLQTLIKRG